MTSTGWDRVALRDFCQKIGSGSTPRGGDAVYVEAGTALIRSQIVYNGEFSYGGLAFLGDSEAEALRGVTVQSGDVLLNITGDSVARCCTAPEEVLPARVNQHVAIIRPQPDELIARFLAYYLISPFMQETMLSMAGGGGTRKALTKDMIERFAVPKPPLDHQERIVAMLSGYDDLIDNNRRRIKLLEGSVRLLFDEWFVRLRFPGHEQSTSSDRTPNGWIRSTLGQVARSLEDGDWIESKDQGGSDFRLLQISNVGLNEFRETGNLRFISEETFRRLRCREIKPGMILIARMPTPIGRAMLVTEMPWRMVTAVDVAIVDPDDDLLNRHYLLYHLNSAENLARCEGRTVGATRPRVTRRELAELPLLVPDKRTQQAFSEVAADVQAQRHILSRQADKLRTARDLLLPRLMSGELTV